MLVIAVSLADLQKGGQKPISKYRFDRIKWNIIKHHNLLSHIKTREEILTFGHIEIETKIELYRHKSPNFLKDVDIEKILVFNKI